MTWPIAIVLALSIIGTAITAYCQGRLDGMRLVEVVYNRALRTAQRRVADEKEKIRS